MRIVLGITYHDPEGRLTDQIQQVMPTLDKLFDGMAVHASPRANNRSLEFFSSAGAVIQQRSSDAARPKHGDNRRAIVQRALKMGADYILYSDGDRVFHWAMHYPQELAQVVTRLPEHDFTVLGRSTRAFQSHPRVQRDTEAIINQVYAAQSGNAWDMAAAARGLSRRAAKAIIVGCHVDSVGVDVAWPLFLQQEDEYSIGYISTEGLEFETADRYVAEVAAAGGLAGWIAQIDADPRQWLIRLQLAHDEIEAIIPYTDHK